MKPYFVNFTLWEDRPRLGLDAASGSKKNSTASNLSTSGNTESNESKGIAKILLLMKRSAVSGCAYLVPHKRKHLCQNELQPVGFIAPSFCFLLPTFPPFFKYDPCHFLWVYRAKTYFCKCTTTLRHFSLQFWLGQGKSDSECNVDLCSVKHG